MIEQLPNVPDNIVAFKASHEVTKDDFDRVILPAVNALVAKEGELNYLLVLDTPLKNFTLGAWYKDAVVGIQHLLKWNRAAIVTDTEGIQLFTNMFSKLMPGEFKGFDKEQLPEAIRWVSGSDKKA